MKIFNLLALLGFLVACQDPSQTANTVRRASLSIAWSSMREAVIELQGSNALELGVVASRETSTPAYMTSPSYRASTLEP